MMTGSRTEKAIAVKALDKLHKSPICDVYPMRKVQNTLIL